jgi:chaperonin cofactor prefoldin
MRPKGDLMAKKKETIQDILDRINEDIETIREKVEELESDVDSDFNDEEDEE